MKTVIWANCQGCGVEYFLRKSGWPGDVRCYRNFMVYLGQEPFSAVENAVRACDLLLAQPTDPNKTVHELTMRLVHEVLPKSARVLYFQPVACHAYFPLVPDGGKHGVIPPVSYFGFEDIEPLLATHTLQEVLAEYDSGKMDFRCRWRLQDSIVEQTRREVPCNIRVSGYMMQNHQKRLFLSQNHPTSRIMAEMARQVWKLALDRDVQPEWSCDNEIALPCSEPLSQYVINELAMDGYVANPRAHEHFRNMLHGAWNLANGLTPTIYYPYDQPE